MTKCHKTHTKKFNTLPRNVLPSSFLLSFASFPLSCFVLVQQFLLPLSSVFWRLSGQSHLQEKKVCTPNIEIKLEVKLEERKTE